MTIEFWENVKQEIEETGNYGTGYGKRIGFFFPKSYPTKESRIDYCNRMIKQLKIQEMNYNGKVGDFMLGAEQSIESTPAIENAAINELRINLIQEELNELKEALKNNDKIEALDALVDLQYVLSGAINQLGYSQIFDLAFEEVHENNMTKFPKTEEKALETVNFYIKQGVPCFTRYNIEIDAWVVKRKSDGKVLKPEGFKGVSLKEFIV